LRFRLSCLAEWVIHFCVFALLECEYPFERVEFDRVIGVGFYDLSLLALFLFVLVEGRPLEDVFLDCLLCEFVEDKYDTAVKSNYS
jgi:hypothetical protein